MSSAKLSLGLAARAGSAVVVVDTGGDARRIGAGGGFGGASDAGVGSGAAVPPTNMENMSSNVSSGAGARSRGRARRLLVVVVDGTDAIVGVSTHDSRGTDGGSGVGDDARARSSDSRSRLARSTSASSATRLTHAYADVVSLLASVTGAPIVDNGALGASPSSSPSDSVTTSYRLDLGGGARGGAAAVVFPFPRVVFTGGGLAAAGAFGSRRRFALALAPASRVVAFDAAPVPSSSSSSFLSTTPCRSLARVIRRGPPRPSTTSSFTCRSFARACPRRARRVLARLAMARVRMAPSVPTARRRRRPRANRGTTDRTNDGSSRPDRVRRSRGCDTSRARRLARVCATARALGEGPRARAITLSRARVAARAQVREREEETIPSDDFKPEELKFQDIVSLWVTQILQTYGDAESKDNAPVCEGVIDDLVGGPIFLALYPYFRRYGGVFKLAFGPKVFMVLSDPVVVREVLKEKPFSFDKGVLAEILEPIMGQGLIPAPYAIWKNRRRQLVPGFHKAWLDHMVGLFGHCSGELVRNLDAAAAAGETVDMEERFCSVSLDIIGLAVFNYDFGSVTKESPIISAVYNCLQEAAHRSTFYFPYWNLPFATDIVPRQREFKQNMAVINDTLNGLIAQAQQYEGTDDLEELQNRDYSKVKDPSLLRFLVDVRGADVTDAQLRDDLMTMLIAGHETTAAVLTWGLFCLVQKPELMKRIQADIEEVFGDDDRAPTYEDIQRLESVRLCVAEALRLYPEPPILIRRCLEDVTLPKGAGDREITLIKGMDIFISVWNLHRSPECWENPDEFDPFRFKRPFTNPGVKDWAGYDPDLLTGLYPNEIASDYAFIPFGAGARKCIGDQFAMLESTVAMTMTLRDFDFELQKNPEDVGMEMGATIHTAGGLPMKVTRRRR